MKTKPGEIQGLINIVDTSKGTNNFLKIQK